MSWYYWVAIILWAIDMVLFGHMIRDHYNATKIIKKIKERKKERHNERLK